MANNTSSFIKKYFDVRVVIGFLIAPLLIVLLLGGMPYGKADYITHLTHRAAFVYLHVLILGIPMYLLLATNNKIKLLHYLISGFIVTAIAVIFEIGFVGQLWFRGQTYGYNDFEGLYVYVLVIALIFGVIGAISSGVFWLIAVAKKN